MAAQDETRKLLAYIASRMGGVEALAAKLQVTPALLTAYITGQKLIPDPLVLRVVDVILDEMDPCKGRQGTPKQPVVESPLDAKPDG